jgi:hypothetical protein
MESSASSAPVRAFINTITKRLFTGVSAHKAWQGVWTLRSHRGLEGLIENISKEELRFLKKFMAELTRITILGTLRLWKVAYSIEGYVEGVQVLRDELDEAADDWSAAHTSVVSATSLSSTVSSREGSISYDLNRAPSTSASLSIPLATGWPP